MQSPLETAVNSPAARPAAQCSAPVAPPPTLFNFAAHLFGLNEARAGKIAYIDDAGTTTYGAASRPRYARSACIPRNACCS
jgi:benzoate-CoA ligase